MATIDIALPDELTQALTPPACLDLSAADSASTCRELDVADRRDAVRAWPTSPAAFRPTAR